MQQCRQCEGFVPAKLHACPHCETPVIAIETAASATAEKVEPKGFLSRLSKRVRHTALTLGTGAAMMTLMACYGGPPQAFCGKWEDKDGDGVQHCADVDYKGWQPDCNDNDKTIYPGAEDKVGDGIDQNCDGKDGINQ